jgi:hypothetical protein
VIVGALLDALSTELTLMMELTQGRIRDFQAANELWASAHSFARSVSLD